MLDYSKLLAYHFEPFEMPVLSSVSRLLMVMMMLMLIMSPVVISGRLVYNIDPMEEHLLANIPENLDHLYLPRQMVRVI